MNLGRIRVRPEFSYISGDITPAYAAQKGVASDAVYGDVEYGRCDVSRRVCGVRSGCRRRIRCLRRPGFCIRFRSLLSRGAPRRLCARALRFAGGQYGGKLVVESLLPAQGLVEKVGGPGTRVLGGECAEEFSTFEDRRGYRTWRLAIGSITNAAGFVASVFTRNDRDGCCRRWLHRRWLKLRGRVLRVLGYWIGRCCLGARAWI